MLKNIELENICGIEKEFLMCSIKKLNFELCKDSIGTPKVRIQDWSEGKEKDLIIMHLTEFLQLKSVIDEIVLDFVMNKEQFELGGESERA